MNSRHLIESLESRTLLSVTSTPFQYGSIAARQAVAPWHLTVSPVVNDSGNEQLIAVAQSPISPNISAVLAQVESYVDPDDQTPFGQTSLRLYITGDTGQTWREVDVNQAFDGQQDWFFRNQHVHYACRKDNEMVMDAAGNLYILCSSNVSELFVDRITANNLQRLVSGDSLTLTASDVAYFGNSNDLPQIAVGQDPHDLTGNSSVVYVYRGNGSNLWDVWDGTTGDGTFSSTSGPTKAWHDVPDLYDLGALRAPLFVSDGDLYVEAQPPQSQTFDIYRQQLVDALSGSRGLQWAMSGAPGVFGDAGGVGDSTKMDALVTGNLGKAVTSAPLSASSWGPASPVNPTVVSYTNVENGALAIDPFTGKVYMFYSEVAANGLFIPYLAVQENGYWARTRIAAPYHEAQGYGFGSANGNDDVFTAGFSIYNGHGIAALSISDPTISNSDPRAQDLVECISVDLTPQATGTLLTVQGQDVAISGNAGSGGTLSVTVDGQVSTFAGPIAKIVINTVGNPMLTLDGTNDPVPLKGIDINAGNAATTLLLLNVGAVSRAQVFLNTTGALSLSTDTLTAQDVAACLCGDLYVSYASAASVSWLPTSSIAALAPIQNSRDIAVSWSGTDRPGGGGITSYDVYVGSYRAGQADVLSYDLWLSGTTATSAVYQADPGYYYDFVSIAHDNAGYFQPFPLVAQATTLVPAVSMVGAYVFYNNSKYDGYDPAASQTADAAAIAPDKSPLLAGQPAGNANFTSYAYGINGIIIDLANLFGATLGPDDIRFYAGNTTNPAAWAAAPTPQTTAFYTGGGQGGSDRLEWIWADDAIVNEWLAIKLMGTANTGIPLPFYFFFGNLIGDTSNAPAGATAAVVNSADVLNVKANNLLPASISSPYDFNRDGVTNSTDVLTAKANNLNYLVFFTAPPAT